MDYQVVLQVICTVLVILLGYVSLYLKKRGDLLSMVATVISYAEDKYKDATEAGGEKFTWCCEKLYAGIPVWLRPMISYQDIEKLVQSTFDEIEAYANLQLNNFVDEFEAKFADEIYNSAAD
ncbi:MAG: hypothetical protein IIV02_04370 [Peptococcaceae bacterium]|nr:hypothetical protein [Peptococcaceae bacterium]